MRHSTVHMYAWSSYILAGSALRAYGGTRHPWPCGVWMHVRAYARRVCCFLVVFVDVDAVVYCTRYEVRVLLLSTLSRYHHVSGGTFSNVL